MRLKFEESILAPIEQAVIEDEFGVLASVIQDMRSLGYKAKYEVLIYSETLQGEDIIRRFNTLAEVKKFIKEQIDA